jgi:hypothetical protein
VAGTLLANPATWHHLTLGAGLGVGLGLSETPSGTTFTVFVPAPRKTDSSTSSSFLAVPAGTKCHKSKVEASGTLWMCYTPARGG